jgi:hypothetical protein
MAATSIIGSKPSGHEQRNATDPVSEGEGSRTAAREFNAARTEFAPSAPVERKARAAKKAVEGAEGKALKRAARTGRSRAAAARIPRSSIEPAGARHRPRKKGLSVSRSAPLLRNGSGGRDRTDDRSVNSRLLYR